MKFLAKVISYYVVAMILIHITAFLINLDPTRYTAGVALYVAIYTLVQRSHGR